MDYPKSDPRVGLHNGKFTDGSADGTIKPSLDTAAHDNALTDEILNVIKAGGLVPDEGDVSQLRQAIMALIAENVVVDTMKVVAKAAAYTALVADRSKLIDYTGAYTLAFTAAATLGDGWWCAVRNSGTGTVTLDPNGAELIDGLASVTLSPGESCLVVCNGAAFKTVGRAINAAHGQCRLTKSGAYLLLSPYNGSKLIINGVVQTVPAAGVNLAPTGLVAATTCYVYAYMNGANMALEASATGHSTSADGVEIKIGDATRTLVGMVYVVAGPAFADTYQQRFVLSYFNRRDLPLISPLTADVSTSSTSYTQVTTASCIQFLTWADEGVTLSASGGATISASLVSYGAALCLDGVVQDGCFLGLSPNNGYVNPFAVSGVIYAVEGPHTANVMNYVGSGTLTLKGGPSAGYRVTVQGKVRG